MKERILKNWTPIRVLYIVIGCAIIIQSYLNFQWIGIAIGSYFFLMGLLAFGCASGNCYTSGCETKTKQTTNCNIDDADNKELNTK